MNTSAVLAGLCWAIAAAAIATADVRPSDHFLHTMDQRGAPTIGDTFLGVTWKCYPHHRRPKCWAGFSWGELGWGRY